MGLLSWLFPSEADRLERARRDLEKGRWNEARLAALELSGPEAEDVVDQAERALCKLNLEHAVSWAEAKEPERVAIHMQLARDFERSDLQDAFRDARRRIREIGARHEAEAAHQDRHSAAFKESVDPRFLAEQASPDLPLPDGASEAEAEALKARLAMLHDGYPEALRDGMVALGPDFASAVLKLEDGEAEAALQTLLALPDDAPLVQHERARAAHALGDPAAAARAWTRFAELAGGHHTMGHLHTAAALANVEAEAGDFAAGLRTLEAARKTEPEVGGALYARLLELTGDLPGAERVLRGLLKTHGPAAGLYTNIARVRLAGGHREAAIDALETSLRQTECTPGKCGYRPPDLRTHRMLATLYLEDGVQTDRALELAETARSLVEQPTWDDVYLAALVAKVEGRAEYGTLVSQLKANTPEGHPQRDKLVRMFPAA